MPSSRKKSVTKSIPQKTNYRLDRLYQISGVLILAVVAILIGLKLIHHYQAIPLPSTDLPEITRLPNNFKKQLNQTATTEAKLKIPVLMYHYVEYVQDKKDTLRQSLDVTPDVFDQQVKTLKDAGYNFLTMADVADILDGKTSLPAKPVVLTFDDGYRDFYTDAFPIIKKYNVKVTAYIVPGFINGPNSMFSDQLIEATESGLVEVGAHTVHHVYLKGQGVKNATKEIDDSKSMLENYYHVPVVSFAYPYGAFDQQAIDLVKQDGFRTAVSTVPGIEISNSNRFFIFRLRPGSKTGKSLLYLLEETSFKPY